LPAWVMCGTAPKAPFGPPGHDKCSSPILRPNCRVPLDRCRDAMPGVPAPSTGVNEEDRVHHVIVHEQGIRVLQRLGLAKVDPLGLVTALPIQSLRLLDTAETLMVSGHRSEERR